MISKRVWCFRLFCEGWTFSIMSIGKGKWTGYEYVTSQTPEIGDYLDFKLYHIV